MIKEIDSFEEYLEFINDVASDPCYSDHHYDYDKENLFNTLKDDIHKAYITLENGTVTGIFVWMILLDDRNIEMIIGLSREESAYLEMFNYIEKQFPKNQMDFVVNPKNSTLCNVLKSKHAQFDPEQQTMRLMKEVDYVSDCQIQLFSPEYEQQYLSLHRKDMFWTGDKVLKADDVF